MRKFFPLRLVTITRCDDEFRVPSPDGGEAAAYYTDDSGDAIKTAIVMWDLPAERFKFKRVNEHPDT